MPFSAASFFASGLAPTFPPVAGIGVGIETGVGIGAATETNVINVLIMLIYNIFQFSVAIFIIQAFSNHQKLPSLVWDQRMTVRPWVLNSWHF